MHRPHVKSMCTEFIILCCLSTTQISKHTKNSRIWFQIPHFPLIITAAFNFHSTYLLIGHCRVGDAVPVVSNESELVLCGREEVLVWHCVLFHLTRLRLHQHWPLVWVCRSQWHYFSWHSRTLHKQPTATNKETETKHFVVVNYFSSISFLSKKATILQLMIYSMY